MNENKYLAAGVFPMFLRSKLKDFEGSDYVRDQVKKYFRYIENYGPSTKYKGHGIMFFGLPVASGADMLLNLLCKKALVCGHTALLLSAEDTVNLYKEQNFALGKLSEADFLFIMGIGSQQPNNLERKVIHSTLTDRYYQEKPTSLLSTVDLSEGETSILSYYGDEVAEIIEHRCLVLECVVSKHRRDKRTQSFRKEIFGE